MARRWRAQVPDLRVRVWVPLMMSAPCMNCSGRHNKHLTAVHGPPVNCRCVNDAPFGITLAPSIP